MVRKVLAVMACFALVFALGACKKKEEKKAAKEGAGPGIVVPQGPPQVVVPESVKGKWNAVLIAVENKETKKVEDVKIGINSEYTIPGTAIKIMVGDFLPDFKMEGSVITSTSDEKNNPAVKIVVVEGENEIFKGWLYSKFPAIHPFQHEKYGLTLKDAVSKG